MIEGLRLTNAATVNRALDRLIPDLDDAYDDTNRDITEQVTARARGTFTGVFSRRIGDGLRAGVADGVPAMIWSGGVVLSGGGTIDDLWGAAEWGSSAYPWLPARRDAGHLFATLSAAQPGIEDTWTDTLRRSIARTV
jgi:hypothetical protein